jgi:hypothetical protein
LNTKYLMFRPHKDRNFVPIGGERQAVNQDAIVKLIGFGRQPHLERVRNSAAF